MFLCEASAYIFTSCAYFDERLEGRIKIQQRVKIYRDTYTPRHMIRDLLSNFNLFQ